MGVELEELSRCRRTVMVELTASSLGPLAWIDGFRGKVLAVYPTACYLAGVDGQLLVVHDETHGHTSTSVLLRDAYPIGWGVKPGSSATGRLGHLRIDPVLLDARNARVWRPAAPQPGTTASSTIDLLRQAAGNAIDRLNPACRRLVVGLDAGRPDLIDSSLDLLIGAGPGLTPSGDDALVGLLAVLHRVAPTSSAMDQLRQLRSGVLARLQHTTEISAHYLRLAVAGHFGEHLTSLVDACAGGATPDDETVTHVRNTGATSGADVLVGIAAGLSWLAGGSDVARAADAA